MKRVLYTPVRCATSRPAALLAGLTALLPMAVQAHGWGGRNTPLFDGMMHVVVNPAFILPLLAIALLASRGGHQLLSRSQLAVAAGVALGSALAVAGLHWAGVAIANRLFIVLAGLQVVLALPLSQRWLLGIAVCGAALTGHELLVSEPPEGNVLLFCTGAVLGALLLHGAGGAITLLSSAPWSRIAVRVAGSWITAIGVIYAGLLFVPVR